MRAWGWVGGLVGWLSMAGALGAQTANFDAAVRVPMAEVRGGPSDVFPVTGRLRQGQPVHIVGERDGFYAITPPAGSSSWVMDRALKPMQAPARGRATDAYVLADDAPVHLGSADAPSPLPVEAWRNDGHTQRLKRGTIVRLLGDESMADNTLWRRIQPTPAEVRFVPKEILSPPQASTVVSASPGAGSSGMTGGNQTTHPLWAQAEQAERSGDYNRAELLYRQLADQIAQPGGDHLLATRCYNRIDQLARRRAQFATWPARQPAPGVLVSGRPNPVNPVPPPAAPAASSGSVASGPGWLRRSGVPIDGRPAYVLEDDRGQPRYYLLAQPGLNLEFFANRYVEVFGPMVPRTDMAGGYMSVNRLHLLR
jgi:hypothetical protein